MAPPELAASDTPAAGASGRPPVAMKREAEVDTPAAGLDPSAGRLRSVLQTPSRVLLVRLRSLGDSILSLPLVDALGRAFPRIKTDVVVEAPFAPVFGSHPSVNDTLVLRTGVGRPEEGLSRTAMLAAIRKRRYDAVFNLHGGTTSFLLSLGSGAPLRVGQQSFRRSWAYNVRIPPSSAVWRRGRIHTVEHQLTVVAWMGLAVPDPITLDLRLQPAAEDAIERRLRQSGLAAGGFVHVHPTATLETKQWPAERFAEVADTLAGETGLPVVFTSGRQESSVLRRVAERAARQHACWSDLGLAELFALIARARLFVGNDSGPTHAAAALGTPVCVVWGSSSFDAWRPWSDGYEAVRSDLPCMPCPGYTCEAYGRPRCVLDIPAAEVLDACRRSLRRPFRRRPFGAADATSAAGST